MSISKQLIGEAGFSPERLDAITNMVQSYVDAGKIAGANIRITRRGKTAYSESIGQADMERNAPMTPETRFRIYSMTKPITVVAALILFERGLFDLDDYIEDYIPAFASARIFESFDGKTLVDRPALHRITIRHLLTMTSGMSYGFTDKGLDTYYKYRQTEMRKAGTAPTLENMVNMLADCPLSFEPGSDYFYSFSIDVIGRLVEVLSGMKFGDFLTKEIFEPLKMHDTAFSIGTENAKHLARIYYHEDGSLKSWVDREIGEGIEEPAFQMPGGGLLSTADDYNQFCTMLLDNGSAPGGRILGRKTVEMMWRNYLWGKPLDTFSMKGKPGYGYGLGVRTMMDPAAAGSNGSAGEWGWDGMATTWMCIDPVEQLTAVFLIQLIPYGSVPVLERFKHMMYAALE